MSDNLTPRQGDLLQTIRAEISAGRPPSLRSLAKLKGCSYSWIAQLLAELRRKNAVEWEADKSRTLRVVERPRWPFALRTDGGDLLLCVGVAR